MALSMVKLSHEPNEGVGKQVGWLILLLPGVGWDIMGYESEPLSSYPE